MRCLCRWGRKDEVTRVEEVEGLVEQYRKAGAKVYIGRMRIRAIVLQLWKGIRMLLSGRGNCNRKSCRRSVIWLCISKDKIRYES